ncbi:MULTISPECIES: PEPxxWA-CTERM sorting domain-containing protein [Edaphosphingomonas]|uniref:Ice-binding protein C-terminal domain-containing protein n=2 Tax=Edaphosphingomonas TaxID=3423724 RepID=A0A1S1HC20_9SPHN|nr:MULTISPECIES: PEPxxWA-CTERM sorting domain-containing protein [Sphingomonas]OHT19789.1 hypothetical protein BHE75_01778 [Sphingomonas haloaromaticamans]
MRKLWGVAALSAAVMGAALAAVPASAAIVIYTSPGAVSPSDNVQFNDGYPNPANPLQAETNHGTLVTFESNELLYTPSSGQARITGTDSNLTTLTFYLTNPALAMSEVEFRLTDPNGNYHTTATIDFYDQFGVATTLSGFTLSNGADWFSAQGTDGSLISKVVITTADNINDVRQVRVTPTALPLNEPLVPEPSTWAMLITGFGLVGAAMRRRRGQAAFA